MRKSCLKGLVVSAAFLLSTALAAEESDFMRGAPAGNLLVGGSGRVMILSPQGKVLWQQKAGLVHDAWMLPNGNVLFADGSVTEVTPDNQVVFQYKPENGQGGGAYACQRLENGHTLIGENATGRILEVDASSKVVFSLPLQPTKPGDHNNMRLARKLKNGNYLVCLKAAHLVREVTPKGETVLEIKTANIAFAAVRTPGNTTYVSSLDAIIEYDAAGKKIWEFNKGDLAGTVITNMTGMHLLPNGNLAVGCYAAYNKNGEGAGLFEITRDKKAVWRYANPKGDGSMMAIQCLDASGKPLPGENLR